MPQTPTVPAAKPPSSQPSANGRTPAGAADSPSSRLPNETLISWLRMMLLIREFEVRCAQAYQQAKIGGFCHLYIGQEACAVGTLAATVKDDPVITAYRDHGHALARGMSARACMAEMFGKITGCAKGKGGSMHMFDRPNQLYGGHGIVGAQTPLGAGLAFATKYKREVMKETDQKLICLCYLGDGALNQGALHEAMNLAGLYSLPVIYIVENNRYSMGTAIERGTTMAHNLLAKSAAYGIEGLKIDEDDGMNILRLYDLFKPFADHCRETQRPGFVDLHTYRYQGHSMSDPQKYRTKEEVDKVKEKDSIDLLAKHLMDGPDKGGRGALSEQQFIELQKSVKDEVRDAVQFAEESPAPDPETELYSDVYVNIQPNLSPIRDYVHGVKNPLL
jgi:pyruvate dehydrogenase E1 component alpha subunit